jgi:hypothetical protein
MDTTDLRHFLNERDVIGPAKGPARTMAEFQAAPVAQAAAPAAS